MSAELPVMAYEPGASADSDRVLRGICTVGVIHGLACAAYVGQRAARWLAGGMDIFEQTQSATFAGIGLTVQAVLGVTLAVCCLLCIYRPSNGIRATTAIVATTFGVIWYAFGIADYLPSFFAYTNERVGWLMIARTALTNFCRETNQAIVPALIAFATARLRSVRALTRGVQLAVVVSCFIYLEPLLEFFYADLALDAEMLAYFRRGWAMAAAFGFLGLLIAFGARPWRIIAALPLVAIVFKDVYLGGALRWSLLSSDLTFKSVTMIIRQLSFLMIVSAPAIASFTIFTILNAPRPGSTLRQAKPSR